MRRLGRGRREQQRRDDGLTRSLAPLLPGGRGAPRRETPARVVAERAGFETEKPADQEPTRADIGTINGYGEELIASEIDPPGRSNDESTTFQSSPRLALVAALADAVKAATVAGDLPTARVASRALRDLLADDDNGETIDGLVGVVPP